MIWYDYSILYAQAVAEAFPPLPKLWIAQADNRYYDDGGTWVVGVFESLEGAKAFCDAEFTGPKGVWVHWNPGGPGEYFTRTYTAEPKSYSADPTVTIEQISVRP